MNDLYLWIKAFHIISMTAWMAGLFYLPRIFVYHSEQAPPGSDKSEVFKIMEYKLLYFIMVPSMILTWAFGIVLMLMSGNLANFLEIWLYVKIICVAILTFFNFWCLQIVTSFKEDRNRYSGKFFRLMNEVPTVLLILIVILVVIKPF